VACSSHISVLYFFYFSNASYKKFLSNIYCIPYFSAILIVYHVFREIDRIPVMHLKCIHELCSLLLHIIHICISYKVISMFYIIFWDYSMILSIFVITLQNRNLLFCVFLSFRGLYGVNRLEFFGINILQRLVIWSFEIMQTEPGKQKSLWVAWPTPLAAPPRRSASSSAFLHPSRAPNDGLDLRTLYNRVRTSE
jgi:hypothetical protein